MMTMRCLLLACALAVASGLPVLADSVVADVQVVTVGDHAWVIRIRTSEAQGFDVLDPGTPFVVRLHGARLAQAMAAVAPAAFGRVALSEGAGGVDVQVTLANASFQARAAQGPSADLVEIHVARAQ